MIGTCTKCHQLYDFGSEEAAHEPDRLCPTCYIAGGMRRTLDAQTGEHVTANRWVTPTLHAHRSRYGRDWRMELSDETPLSAEQAHAGARACGAPDGTPICSACGGLLYVAQWEDDRWEAARSIGSAFWQGTQP